MFIICNALVLMEKKMKSEYVARQNGAKTSMHLHI